MGSSWGPIGSPALTAANRLLEGQRLVRTLLLDGPSPVHVGRVVRGVSVIDGNGSVTILGEDRLASDVHVGFALALDAHFRGWGRVAVQLLLDHGRLVSADRTAAAIRQCPRALNFLLARGQRENGVDVGQRGVSLAALGIREGRRGGEVSRSRGQIARHTPGGRSRYIELRRRALVVDVIVQVHASRISVRDEGTETVSEEAEVRVPRVLDLERDWFSIRLRAVELVLEGLQIGSRNGLGGIGVEKRNSVQEQLRTGIDLHDQVDVVGLELREACGGLVPGSVALDLRNDGEGRIRSGGLVPLTREVVT